MKSSGKLFFTLRQHLGLLLAGALSLLWLAAAWNYRKIEAEALAQIHQQTNVLALAFAENTESTFQRTDQYLVNLREAWLAGPQAFADAMTRYQDLMVGTPIQLAIIDAEGSLAFSNLALPKGHIFLEEREHFKVHQESDGDRLSVSRPLKEQVSGKWSIQLTRPIIDKGHFAGFIILSVDPSYFVRFYKKIDLGTQGQIEMVRDTHEIMARSQRQEDYIGKALTTVFDTAPGAPLQGHFRSISEMDGIDRLNGYYRLPTLGLTVIASSSIAEQMMPVHGQQRTMLATAMVATLLLLFMSWRMWRNIAHREEAEAIIAANEERLRTMFRFLPIGVALTDLNGHIVDCNSASERLLGISKAEHLKGDYHGKKWKIFRSDGTQMSSAEYAIVRANVEPRSALNVTMEVRSRQGSKWLEMSATPLTHPLYGMVISYVDIAAGRDAEIRLKLAASVFTHAREGIAITDATGTILEVNDTFARITGYSRKQAVGHNPRILNSGRQSPEYYTAMWRALAEKGDWSGEIWNRRRDGEIHAQMLTISAVRDATGKTQNYVALFTDIAEIKEHQQRLEYMAHYDALTSLPNRVLLADRLRQAFAQCQQRGDSLAVLYLDLDGFKSVNDQYGHDVGDELLIAITKRMKTALREGDTLGRIGGDEFIAVLIDLERMEDCEPMIARLLQAASDPVTIGDAELQVSVSIGVTLYPQDRSDADRLIRHADQAMYQAKLAGKNRYHLFDVAQEAAMRVQQESLDHIRRALVRHEFMLYYQPKVNMRTGDVVGAEALIRWNHPIRGLLSPAAFLPVIENHLLGVELGEWVIDAALSQMSAWHTKGLDIAVSVNIGAHQLQQGDFVQRLSELLAAHPDVHPGSLELEVLETSELEDAMKVSETMRACCALGVTFALDDFGTGYSSLTYLKRLPAKVLKIDQSFVRNMLEDSDDLAIVDAVVRLAATFRRKVIAEGVETIDHGELLLALGCELAQGYVIARPMPGGELPGWVATWRPDVTWTDSPRVVKFGGH